MKKIKLLIAMMMFGSSFYSNAQDTSSVESKPMPKIVLGINFGVSTIDHKASFTSEITYGVKYKKHFFGFNYFSSELTIKDKAVIAFYSKPVFNFMSMGYLQQYSLYQRERRDVALSIGVAYSEFGIQDLSTSSFFHSGNMINIDRLVSIVPGINFQSGILNLDLSYRYSISVKKSNVFDPSVSNGLNAMIGIRFEVDKQNKR